MSNRYTLAKDVQKEFYRRYNLLITREQAFEIVDAMKHRNAMYRSNGNYVSTRSNDTITGASTRGVQVGAYKTFYSTKEWNTDVLKGDYGKHHNPYADDFRYFGEEMYIEETR